MIAWNETLTTSYPAGSFLCTLDGTSRQSVVIDLDQLAPVAALSITGYMPGGVGPCIPAADCQTFAIGDVICGTYSVTDEHLGGFSLQAQPTPSPTSGFTVDGAAGNGLSYPNPSLPMSGTKSGAWTYNTPACRRAATRSSCSPTTARSSTASRTGRTTVSSSASAWSRP